MNSNGLKNTAIIILLLTVIGLYIYIEKSKTVPTIKSITIVQDKPQEWADALKLGLNDGLRDQGLKEGIDVVVKSRSATGDPQGLTGLAEAVIRQKSDVLYTLGTQSTQAVFSVEKKRNIVFGAITDPIKAGLYDTTLNTPRGNITGTQDLWPYSAQFSLIKKILPSINKLGIIYNGSEVNSQVSVEHIKVECKKNGIQLIERAVTEDSQILGAVSGLLNSGIDALFIPADNTAQGASQVIIAACMRRRIPVFTGIPGIVENGAIATVGTNYYELGKVNALQITRILKGAQAKDIPVQIADKGDVYINIKAAKVLGINIPNDIKQLALKVYE